MTILMMSSAKRRRFSATAKLTASLAQSRLTACNRTANVTYSTPTAWISSGRNSRIYTCIVWTSVFVYLYLSYIHNKASWRVYAVHFTALLTFASNQSARLETTGNRGIRL